MKKIFLITKLKTTNIGNEALSTEIINLFSSLSNNNTLNVNGRPFGLDGYYPSRIINKTDPVETLEKWADAIVKQMKKESSASFDVNIPKVKLLNGHQSSLMQKEKLKAKLRPLKRWLLSFSPYANQYKKRAATLKNADWLIYSGAGEVGDNIVFLRQLVEIRAAQKMGIRTAAVNQSVVIKTEPFKKLVGHVYGKMDKIVIRGEVTRQNLSSYGVNTNIIEVAPDSAINSNFINAGNTKKNNNLVGINITPRIKITDGEMDAIVKALQGLGKKIIFITNEPFEDSKVAVIFKEKYNIEFVNDFAGCKDYMAKIAECDFVISARLHTNILSLVTNTIIIPIEGNVFKSTELLKQLEYPVATLNSAKEGWANELVNEINNVHNNKYAFDNYFKNTFPIYKLKVQRNAAWLNDVG